MFASGIVGAEVTGLSVILAYKQRLKRKRATFENI